MANTRKFTGCLVTSCDKPHKGLGFCSHHYLLNRSRKQRLGEEALKYSFLGEFTTLCKAERCFKKTYCGGFCNLHYRRFKKGKSFDIPDASKNRYLIGNLDFVHIDRNSWSNAIKQYFGDKCMICKWKEAKCDVHHIIPRAIGGLNSLYNAAVLCPNCHKLADIGKLSQQLLQLLNTKLVNEKIYAI